MIAFWVMMVNSNQADIEDVPKKWRKEVQSALNN